MNKSVRLIALGLAASGVVLTACGLKPEVKNALRAAPGAVYDPNTGQYVDPGGNPVDASGNPIAPGATTGPGGAPIAGAPGSTTGPGGGPSGGGPTSGPTSGPTTGSGDTTGIRNNTIYLALHGPLTGAGVPQESFRSGVNKYWANRTFRGMKVHAEAFDDQYKPSGAVAACRRAAPDFFMILGGAGTDQIQACARDAVIQRNQVPYLSAGVTENGLVGLKNYFAASMTYKQQSPTVVKMAREKGFLNAPHGWALVISDTPNFKDAKDSIMAELTKAGIKYEYIPVPKTGGNSTTVANQLRAGQYETVYFLGQPLFFTEMVGKTGCPAYCPTWTGPGVAMGVNTVARLACGGTGGQFKSYYLSPYPGFQDKDKYVKDGTPLTDDIEFTIYGVMEALHRIFESVPTNVQFNRQNLIATIAKSQYAGNVFPATRYLSRTHFGGTAAYYLRADCSIQQWVTAGGPTA